MVFQRPLTETFLGKHAPRHPLPTPPPVPPLPEKKLGRLWRCNFSSPYTFKILRYVATSGNLPLHRGWPLHAWRFNCSCILANCEFLPWKFCTFNKGKLTVTKLKLLLAPFFNDTTINSSRLHLLQYERVIQLANFIYIVITPTYYSK